MKFYLLSTIIMLIAASLTFGHAYAIVELGTDEDVFVDSGFRFFVDGGGDTSFSETSPDFLTFTTGGVTGIQINSLQNVIISPGRGFFLDGGGDTFIIESTPNVIQINAGGVPAATFTNQGIVIQDTQRLFLDSGGFGSTTYLRETAANRMDFYTSDTVGLSITSTQNVVLQTAKGLFFDGGVSSFIWSPDGDEIAIVGGSGVVIIDGGSLGIGVDPTATLDVAGDIQLTGDIISSGDICIGTCP